MMEKEKKKNLLPNCMNMPFAKRTIFFNKLKVREGFTAITKLASEKGKEFDSRT